MSNEGNTKIPGNQFKNRKTFWYTIKQISDIGECPSCGTSLRKYKNITPHVKRCFSIKKIGPLYRLHGYVECICGLLIADNDKAKKLHLCMGEVPAFEPDFDYAPPLATDHQSISSPRLEHEVLQPKPWLRNCASPLKIKQENSKPEPRVWNFNMATNSHIERTNNVSVYSISSNNGAIFVKGQSPKSGRKSVIVIKKRELRLPNRKGGKNS